MVRIFVSLYGFIAIALIGLSAILDNAFFQHSATEDITNSAVISMLSGLPRDDDTLFDITSSMGLAPQYVNINAISWLPSETTRLHQGEVLLLYTGNDVAQFYVLTQDKALLELTLQLPADSEYPLWLYSLAFFVLLGFVLAIWVWPLWRDLSRLKTTSEQLLPDGSLPPLGLAATSPVKPIGDALNNLSGRVASLLRTQKELSGAVAHEIRTPLSRLKFAMAMKPSPDSAPWHAMQKDLEELERRVQEMLNFTSAEMQEPELNYSEIPFQQLAEQIIKEASRQTDEHLSITLIPTDTIILADEHYLVLAIENLLYNAMRYARHTIRVSISADEFCANIQVEDDGEGVADALVDKIFEPFFRPDDSRDRKRGGAGLGLAIVKRIAQWHRGSCWVESSHLGGACFVLRLPKQTTKS